MIKGEKPDYAYLILHGSVDFFDTKPHDPEAKFYGAKSSTASEHMDAKSHREYITTVNTSRGTRRGSPERPNSSRQRVMTKQSSRRILSPTSGGLVKSKSGS